MTRAKPKKKILSQGEIEGLKDEKHELETSLKEVESYGKGTAAEQVDTGKMESDIRRLEDTIEYGTAKSPRGNDKDKLAKEEKELEDAISEGMPSWYEMHQPTKNPGAVRKHMAWSDRNKINIGRYKQLQRILRPLEPKSIEVLRKER